MEALLWLEFGVAEVEHYLNVSQKRGIYKLDLIRHEIFKENLFVAVVGDGRAKDVAAATQRSAGYAMQTGTARAFGALQDYRAKYGENRNTLLLADGTVFNPFQKHGK